MKKNDAIKKMTELSAQVKDLCQPLLQIGIHTFHCMLNFDDNAQVYFCNQPQWVEDYYYLRLFENNLYDNTPSLFETEYHLWSPPFNHPLLSHGLKYYDQGYGFGICHRHLDHSAFYCFAGSNNSHFLPEFFINNVTFLEQFIRYFRTETIELIHRAKALGLMRQKKKTNSPWGDETVMAVKNKRLQLQKQKQLIEANLEYASIYHRQLGFPLSPRQKQVLYWHSKGKSAKEIAGILGISSRTVERHFDLLRVKAEGTHVIELILKALEAKPSETLLL